MKNHRSKTTFQIIKQIWRLPKNYKRFSSSSQFPVFFFFLSCNKLTRMKMDETMPRKRKQRRHEKFRFQSKNVDVTPIAQKMLSP